MSAEFDKILTIAIGRIDRDGVNLPTSVWNRATLNLLNSARDHGTVVFSGAGNGFTSDQPEVVPEESFAVIVVLPDCHETYDQLKRDTSLLLTEYNMSSACYAIDPIHIPAWATDVDKEDYVSPDV